MKITKLAILMTAILVFGCQARPVRQYDLAFKDEIGSLLVSDVLRKTDYNYAQSAALLSEKAKTGDAEAQQALGQLILMWHWRARDTGESVPYSLEYAWEMYRQAALKSSEAAWVLGSFYLRGDIGLPQNVAIGSCLKEKGGKGRAAECFS